MATDEALDDRIWQFPPAHYDWLNGINSQWGFPQGINPENIHLIFSLSTFCTPESANKRFEILVNKHPELQPKYFHRQEYEKELEEFPGESFVVVSGPRRSEEGMNPVWVVERRWTEVNRAVGSKDVSVRGHYIVVVDTIFAAPTVMDVVESRFTASLLHLSNFYQTASSLPLYSIEKGYTYLHPSQHTKKKSKSAVSSARTSRAASPTGSVSSLSRAKDANGEKNDDHEIARSFNLTLSYGDEYMDENPLVGEPGSFKLSSTARNIKDKEAKEREKAAADLAKSEAARSQRARSEVGESQKTSQLPSPVVGNGILPPPPIKTSGPGLERTKTGLGKGKSPTSATGDGVKKRRKSKAPVTPGPGSAGPS